MTGRPVLESRCVKTRPWPSSDKQSPNHPGAADTMGINSKPVFAHDEGLTVCEMTEDAEGVEEGKMEKKAQEKVAEAKLGVLCSPEGPQNTRAPFRLQDFMCSKISKHYTVLFLLMLLASTVYSSETPKPACADLNLPSMPSPVANKKDRLRGITIVMGILNAFCIIVISIGVLIVKIVREREVFSRKRKKVEYRPTEGGPRNTLPSFHLQFIALLLLLAPSVNSTEAPKRGMCAVCLEKDCAIGVRTIYQADSDTAIWLKANSPTGIQNCCMENLKADAPCKMANGILVQLADNPLYFDGIDTHDVRRVFHSQISPCADLNLPSKPVIQAPIHNVPTPAAPNDSVADNKGIIIGIGIFFGSIIIVSGVLIVKRNSCGQGQDKDHRHGNNGVPPHDAEHRDENTMEKQPLKEEVANGNVNGVH